jgi:hypothetical protein
MGLSEDGHLPQLQGHRQGMTNAEIEQAIKDELARPDTNHQRILHLAYNAWSAQHIHP